MAGGVYAAQKHAFTLVDRKGAATPLPLPPAKMYAGTISPDGKRIAWAQGASAAKMSIWLLDLERGVSRRLTEEGSYQSPVWSPDGTRLAAHAFSADGSPVLAVVDVDRGATATLGCFGKQCGLLGSDQSCVPAADPCECVRSASSESFDPGSQS